MRYSLSATRLGRAGPVLRGVGALLALLPLVGSLQAETVVRIERDGSGTISETVVLSHEVVEMFASMAPQGQPFELRDEQRLRDAAANYGPSVRLLSSRSIETGFGMGYHALYGFDDVESLRIGQDPGASLPGGEAAGAEVPAEVTTFTLDRSDPARLVIHWGGPDGTSGDAYAEHSGAVDEPDAAAMEMTRAALQDLEMAIHVEVAGEVLDSNATHVEGGRITLIDIAFGELMENEDALRMMAQQQSRSVSDMKDLLRFVPGLRVEIEPEVEVLFR